MGRYDEPSWWSRNRSWALPSGGCCGCLVALVLGIIGLTAGGGFALFSSMKSSGAYTEAVARARADARVVALLGEPIETSWLIGGSISLTGSSGEADLAIPLSGPNGEATLYSVAVKTAGEWRFEVLEVAPKDGGGRIDLLGDFELEELPEEQLEQSTGPIAQAVTGATQELVGRGVLGSGRAGLGRERTLSAR